MGNGLKFLFIGLLGFQNLALAIDCTSKLSENFNLDKLKHRIEDCGLETIEQALDVFPKKIFNQYTLIYSSRSVQVATFTEPRAVVFGANNTVMSFNGNPRALGYETIELFRYEENDRVFDFREILIDEKTKKLTVSEKNPSQCVGCHSGDIKPMWAAFNLWPGVYGSQDDFFFKDFYAARLKNKNFQIEDLYKDKKNLPKEFEEYLKFRKIQRTHIRYGLLKDLPSATPNADLSAFLNKFNKGRMARILLESENLRPYRFALMGATACQGDEAHPFKFLSTEQRRKFMITLRSLNDKECTKKTENIFRRLSYIKYLLPDVPYETDMIKTLIEPAQHLKENMVCENQTSDRLFSPTAALRFLIENLDGRLVYSSLSVDFDREVLEYSDGFNGLNDLHLYLAKEAKLNIDFSSKDACKKLQEMSLKELDVSPGQKQ